MKVKNVLGQHNEIVRMAAKMGSRNPEDIAQEIWIKLLKVEEREGDIDKFDFEGRLNYHSIKLLIKNELKKERRDNTVDIDEIEDIPEEELITIDQETKLEEAMLSLPKEDRDLFMRYAINEDTQEEISDDLGVSQKTVSRKIEKIRKFLVTKMNKSSK